MWNNFQKATNSRRFYFLFSISILVQPFEFLFICLIFLRELHNEGDSLGFAAPTVFLHRVERYAMLTRSDSNGMSIIKNEHGLGSGRKEKINKYPRVLLVVYTVHLRPGILVRLVAHIFIYKKIYKITCSAVNEAELHRYIEGYL